MSSFVRWPVQQPTGPLARPRIVGFQLPQTEPPANPPPDVYEVVFPEVRVDRTRIVGLVLPQTPEAPAATEPDVYRVARQEALVERSQIVGFLLPQTEPEAAPKSGVYKVYGLSIDRQLVHRKSRVGRSYITRMPVFFEEPAPPAALVDHDPKALLITIFGGG